MRRRIFPGLHLMGSVLLVGALLTLSSAQAVPAMPGSPGETATDAGPPPDFGSPEMAAAGRQVFERNNCIQCHGAGGLGGVRLVGNSLTPMEAYQTISRGRIRGAMRMPMWQGVLTEQELWEVASYVISLQAQ